MIECNTAHIETNADLLAWQVTNGSENWLALMAFLAASPGERFSSVEVINALGFSVRGTLGGWKRSYAPMGALNTRPFHVGKMRRGEFVYWMDERQAAIVNGERAPA